SLKGGGCGEGGQQSQGGQPAQNYLFHFGRMVAAREFDRIHWYPGKLHEVTRTVREKVPSLFALGQALGSP
ncbi:MAG: hypothetical protein VYE14_06820, partial [Verrucomicrobiota bacterium]|nr:hypothetical protein [Verrucomicrobiota bacterium]